MPRRAAAQIRPIEPDALHGSKLVQQVINKVMMDGKKSLAEQIVYEALDILSKRTGRSPSRRSRSRQGAHAGARGPLAPRRRRHLPGAVEVPPRRARTLAVRWLIEFARGRREKTMAERLAGELLDAQSQQGGAFKRKDDIYRMAQANKAFAHYRW